MLLSTGEKRQHPQTGTSEYLYNHLSPAPDPDNLISHLTPRTQRDRLRSQSHFPFQGSSLRLNQMPSTQTAITPDPHLSDLFIKSVPVRNMMFLGP